MKSLSTFINESLNIDLSHFKNADGLKLKSLGKLSAFSQTGTWDEYIIKDHAGKYKIVNDLRYIVDDFGNITEVEYRYDGGYSFDTKDDKIMSYYASKKFISDLSVQKELKKFKDELEKYNISSDIHIEPKKQKEVYVILGLGYSDELRNEVEEVAKKHKFKVNIAGDYQGDWPRTYTRHGKQKNPR